MGAGIMKKEMTLYFKLSEQGLDTEYKVLSQGSKYTLSFRMGKNEEWRELVNAKRPAEILIQFERAVYNSLKTRDML